MTDFLITEMTLYPWFTWLIVFLALAGVAYVAVWVHDLAGLASDWVARKRAAMQYDASVKRRLAEAPCAVCELAEEEISQLGLDDPPEYQHPDGPDEGYDWDGPEEDWSPGLAWGPRLYEPEREMAGLATVLKRAHDMGLLDDDQLPDGPPAGRAGPPVCEDAKCKMYGWVHPPPCQEADTDLLPKYLDGPAMPPQPVREYLHPAIMDSLEAAGFSEHETNEGAVDSMFTRAQACEVEAMVTDGIIPTGEAGKE